MTDRILVFSIYQIVISFFIECLSVCLFGVLRPSGHPYITLVTPDNIPLPSSLQNTDGNIEKIAGAELCQAL